MSLPKRDPAFTMQDLEKPAQQFLDAGFEYWKAAYKAGISGAVIWLTNTDGYMCIFTRGEYRNQLLANIERLGPTKHFGAMTDEATEPEEEDDK